jgi:AAA family ATP:ADP antiporter
LGLRLSHLAIPCALILNAIGGLFFPTFPVISSIYIAINACDFSLFGILKEMLYLPLKREEKFHAKALIDVFVYRTGKAVASFLILFFQIVHASFASLTWSSILIFLLWTLIVWRFYLREEEIPVHEEITLLWKRARERVLRPLP